MVMMDVMEENLTMLMSTCILTRLLMNNAPFTELEAVITAKNAQLKSSAKTASRTVSQEITIKFTLLKNTAVSLEKQI